MSKHIGDRIRERRKELGLNQPQLAKLIGRSKGAVSQWESGQVKPDRDSLISLEGALNCSRQWLMTGSDIGSAFTQGPMIGIAVSAASGGVSEAPPLYGMCPEISWVQAGQWSEICEVNVDPDNTNYYPRPPGASENTFVLRVVGESMIPEYPPGRLIFVDPDQVPMPNDDVIAVMTDANEATFKRLIEEPGSSRMLKALNPAWNNPYLEINGNCQVIGVVIADMRMRQR
ncbi:MAG: LexA family protein [Pseudomonadota bacterium]